MAVHARQCREATRAVLRVKTNGRRAANSPLGATPFPLLCRPHFPVCRACSTLVVGPCCLSSCGRGGAAEFFIRAAPGLLLAGPPATSHFQSMVAPKGLCGG